jgi:hypothetical protein
MLFHSFIIFSCFLIPTFEQKSLDIPETDSVTAFMLYGLGVPPVVLVGFGTVWDIGETVICA